MKKYLAWLSVILTACSQPESTPPSTMPQAVLQAFKKDFPYAENLSWEKQGLDFEGSFYLEGKEMSAIYDKSGKLWETEESIATTALPAGAIAYINSSYPHSEIKEANKIILDHHSKVLYEAEVNGEDLIFNENGLFLKTGRN